MEHRDRRLTITRVAKQKGRPVTYAIYVNDELCLSVPESLLVQYRIIPGKCVDQEEIELWKYEGEKNIAWLTAVEMLGRKARTSAELERLLLQKGYSSEIVEDAVSRCEEAGYINDLEYAKIWAEHRILRQSKGRRYVMQELRHKGIDRQLIERAIADIDEENEYLKAWEAGKKRWDRLDGDVRERRRKVGMFLARRGFTNSIVNRTIRELSDRDRES